MKRIVLIIFVLLLQHTLSAQYFEGLINKTVIDTGDVNNFLKLAERYSFENPHKSIMFAEKALKLSNKQNYLYGEAKANSVLANNYNILGDYMLAIYHNTEAINIYSKLEIDNKEAKEHRKAGSILSSQAMFDNAKFEFAKALDIYFSLNDRSNIAKTIGNIKMIWELKQMGFDSKSIKNFYDFANKIFYNDSNYYKIYGYAGYVLFNLGNYDRAIKYLNKGIEIAKKSNDNITSSRYLTLIGIINKEKGDYENAIIVFLDALETYKKIDKTQGIIVTNYYLGQLYDLTGDYKKSLNYYLRAANTSEAFNIKRIIPHLYLCAGVSSKEAGNYAKAEEYFLRSKEAAVETDNYSGIAEAFYNLGELKSQLNDNAKAEEYLINSLNNALKANNLYIAKEARKKLGYIASKVGNYQKAYEYQREFFDTKDSIAKIENKILLSNIEARYVLESKENQINILKKNNEINKLNLKNQRAERVFLISVIALVTTVLILMLNRLIIIRRTNKLLKQQKDEIIEKNAKLIKLNSDLETQKKREQYLNKELLQINIKLRKSEERLIETNTAKDKFFSIISHDLRSPFATIVSFAKLLKKDLDKFSKEDLSQMIDEFSGSVAQINNLLENLLQWSRSQTGKINPRPLNINLSDLIDDSLSLFASVFKEKELSINKQLNDKIMVYADRNMADTILRNLISNASKYSYQGQEISIIARKVGEYAEIQVIDKGVGISEENQKNLFRIETAQTTFGTKYEKGSGLGLLLCREFVERLGGNINVISEENNGSTFIFTLPLAEE